MLSIVATPIGNLEDITYRATRRLQEVDAILCEDTRHSRPLLAHYHIDKKLISYHRLNAAKQRPKIIEKLLHGLPIALICDAGTPGISDPGQKLIDQCYHHGIEVDVLPGPCAAIAALSLSGLPSDRFQFCGFLPRTEGEQRSLLVEAMAFPGTSLFHLSPHRLTSALQLLTQLMPEREIALVKELTKIHQRCWRGKPGEIAVEDTRGEWVLLISPSPHPLAEWLSLRGIDHLRILECEYGLSRKEAIKLAAMMRGIPKQELYREINKGK